MPPESQDQGQQTIEVFFSYDHEDEELRDELAKHLSTLKSQGVISAWHDRQIGAGKEWAGEINEHLDKANIILLLVSADFLASDYCRDVEMTRALERHKANKVRVIPVILRPVDWQGAPFGKLQALPKNGKPVTSWANKDEAFSNIAKGIRSVTEEFTGHREVEAKSVSHPEITTDKMAKESSNPVKKVVQKASRVKKKVDRKLYFLAIFLLMVVLLLSMAPVFIDSAAAIYRPEYIRIIYAILCLSVSLLVTFGLIGDSEALIKSEKSNGIYFQLGVICTKPPIWYINCDICGKRATGT